MPEYGRFEKVETLLERVEEDMRAAIANGDGDAMGAIRREKSAAIRRILAPVIETQEGCSNMAELCAVMKECSAAERAVLTPFTKVATDRIIRETAGV